jgi:hypothetical protein
MFMVPRIRAVFYFLKAVFLPPPHESYEATALVAFLNLNRRKSTRICFEQDTGTLFFLVS